MLATALVGALVAFAVLKHQRKRHEDLEELPLPPVAPQHLETRSRSMKKKKSSKKKAQAPAQRESVVDIDTFMEQ